MPKHWFYVPMHEHIDGLIHKMASRYGEKYGTKRVVSSNVHAPGTANEWSYISKGIIGPMKPLKDVKSVDTLLIGAHGSRNKDAVSVITSQKKVAVEQKSYGFADPTKVYVQKTTKLVDVYTRFTPNDLAALLQMDGLSHRHRLIKLNSCFACGTIGDDEFKASDFFAKLLAVELGMLEYNNIIVGGYSGAVEIDTYDPLQPKNVTTENRQTLRTKAKGTRSFYDAKGNVVPTVAGKVVLPG